MAVWRVPPRLVGHPEILDDPDADPRAFEVSLADLRFINRLLGFTAGVVGDVWPLVERAAAGGALRPGCGSGPARGAGAAQRMTGQAEAAASSAGERAGGALRPGCGSGPARGAGAAQRMTGQAEAATSSARGHAGERPVTVLDVGAGSGDMAVALARRARRTGLPLAVVGLDSHPTVLRVARRHLAAVPAPLRAAVRLVRGDGLALPLADGAVDVALASLFLHHLDGALAVALLAELRRVARVGVVVSDLVRHPLALLGIRVLTRLGPFHPMTRHDGALSVRRAYTEAELAELAARAGLGEGGRLVRHPFWRMAWVWTRPGVPAPAAGSARGAAAGGAEARHRDAAGFGPGAPRQGRTRAGTGR